MAELLPHHAGFPLSSCISFLWVALRGDGRAKRAVHPLSRLEADFCEPYWVPPFLDLSGDLEESEALQAPSFSSMLDLYDFTHLISLVFGLFLFIPAHSP